MNTLIHDIGTPEYNKDMELYKYAKRAIEKETEILVRMKSEFKYSSLSGTTGEFGKLYKSIKNKLLVCKMINGDIRSVLQSYYDKGIISDMWVWATNDRVARLEKFCNEYSSKSGTTVRLGYTVNKRDIMYVSFNNSEMWKADTNEIFDNDTVSMELERNGKVLKYKKVLLNRIEMGRWDISEEVVLSQNQFIGAIAYMIIKHILISEQCSTVEDRTELAKMIENGMSGKEKYSDWKGVVYKTYMNSNNDTGSWCDSLMEQISFGVYKMVKELYK